MTCLSPWFCHDSCASYYHTALCLFGCDGAASHVTLALATAFFVSLAICYDLSHYRQFFASTFVHGILIALQQRHGLSFILASTPGFRSIITHATTNGSSYSRNFATTIADCAIILAMANGLPYYRNFAAALACPPPYNQ